MTAYPRCQQLSNQSSMRFSNRVPMPTLAADSAPIIPVIEVALMPTAPAAVVPQSRPLTPRWTAAPAAFLVPCPTKASLTPLTTQDRNTKPVPTMRCAQTCPPGSRQLSRSHNPRTNAKSDNSPHRNSPRSHCNVSSLRNRRPTRTYVIV